MSSQAESVAWIQLLRELEGKLSDWEVPDPDGHAEDLVGKLRRTGWQPTIPERTEPWRHTRPARTEVAKKHIAACRAAIRASSAYG
jgi:hypothetical protein